MANVNERADSSVSLLRTKHRSQKSATSTCDTAHHRLLCSVSTGDSRRIYDGPQSHNVKSSKQAAVGETAADRNNAGFCFLQSSLIKSGSEKDPDGDRSIASPANISPSDDDQAHPQKAVNTRIPCPMCGFCSSPATSQNQRVEREIQTDNRSELYPVDARESPQPETSILSDLAQPELGEGEACHGEERDVSILSSMSEKITSEIEWLEGPPDGYDLELDVSSERHSVDDAVEQSQAAEESEDSQYGSLELELHPQGPDLTKPPSPPPPPPPPKRERVPKVKDIAIPYSLLSFFSNQHANVINGRDGSEVAGVSLLQTLDDPTLASLVNPRLLPYLHAVVKEYKDRHLTQQNYQIPHTISVRPTTASTPPANETIHTADFALESPPICLSTVAAQRVASNDRMLHRVAKVLDDSGWLRDAVSGRCRAERAKVVARFCEERSEEEAVTNGGRDRD
ncbi:hypothetical protein HK102_001609 [Quaeritorhiza haematococci]|nr:hypothetical protein HK102_001609 [Quaeritorhiza haematococci]